MHHILLHCVLEQALDAIHLHLFFQHASKALDVGVSLPTLIVACVLQKISDLREMCNVILQRVFAFQLNILLLLLVVHRIQRNNALLRLLLASKPHNGLFVVIVDVLIVDLLEVLLVRELVLRAAFHQASLLDL